MKVLGMLFVHALGRNDNFICFCSSIDFCGIDRSTSEEYERDACMYLYVVTPKMKYDTHYGSAYHYV